MTRVEEMQCLNANKSHTVGSLQKLLGSTSYRGFPVVAFKKGRHETGTDERTRPQLQRENTFLGYISRVELSFALERITQTNMTSERAGAEAVTQQTPCYFIYHSNTSAIRGIDLRPWMDQTPITLNANSSLQLAVSMFQNLGLRYLLFVDRGAFRGMLTKKDVWWILSASEDRQKSGQFIAGAGALREETEVADDGPDEARGLLQAEPGETPQHLRPG